MMRNIIEQTESFIRKYDMIQKNDVVIAGVSGGADSVCLLFVLSMLREKIGFEVKVCHVNHGIRGADADADEAYVRKICRQLDIPCRFFHRNVELIARKRKQSPEEAGRTVRREAFGIMCAEDGGTRIATAHHRDDNAETMLLNIARGTGLKGLCGIRPVQGVWIRPLLHLDRVQIECWLKEKGIRWCTDATNEEDAYTRNRIRHNILPVLREQVNDKTVSHLEELAVQAREVWEYLEKGTDEAWHRCVEVLKADREKTACGSRDIRLRIDAESLKKEMPAVQKMLIRKCLSVLRGGEKDIGAVHLQLVTGLFDRQCGKSADLPGGIKAERTYSGVVIGRKEEYCEEQRYKEEVRPVIPGTTALPGGNGEVTCRFINASRAGEAKEIPQKSYTKWIDYDIIKCSLSVRTRRSGDYLVIDDAGRRQKLKAWFINEKIPKHERERMLLVADGDHIIWIPGYRMSRACQITESTKTILEIKITEDEKNVREDQSACS